MTFKIVFYIFCTLTCLLSLPISSQSAEITKLDVSIQDNSVLVSTVISLDEKYLEEMRKGIKKELQFYIDIFKMWNIWPDEFILGKLYIRTLQYDPVKTEYIATSNDGETLIEKRFTSLESMVSWASSINKLELVIPKDLKSGAYFVRVIVESKMRKLPPVLGDLLIFIPKNEFKIKKDSPVFYIETVQ